MQVCSFSQNQEPFIKFIVNLYIQSDYYLCDYLFHSVNFIYLIPLFETVRAYVSTYTDVFVQDQVKFTSVVCRQWSNRILAGDVAEDSRL